MDRILDSYASRDSPEGQALAAALRRDTDRASAIRLLGGDDD